MATSKKNNKKPAARAARLSSAKAASRSTTAVESHPEAGFPSPVTPPKAVPVLDVQARIVDLQSTSADVAREAAMALGRAGNSAAVAALAEVVINASGFYHSVVRAAACASLGIIGDRAATPALVHGIADPMAEASAEAVRALAQLRDVRAIDPLIEVVRNPMGYFLPVVRLAAIGALKQFGDPRASAALQAVAANEAEDAVLRAAAR